MLDKKNGWQYNNTCLSWNDRFPPLNLWNYNLHWQWASKFQQRPKPDIEDKQHVDASRRTLA
jgi:hypothetical protein